MSDRRRTTLTHEGWYYALVLSFIVVGAVWQQMNLMIVLAGLMIGPVLLNWRISAATVRRLRVRRHMPQCVHAGESFGVEIAVRNLRRRLSSWFVGVTDRLSYIGSPQTHLSRVDVLLPHVPAGELAKTTYRCCLPARGEYQFGPLTVFTRFPLGLLKSSRGAKEEQRLIVFPKLGTLTKNWYELVRFRQTGFRRSLNRRALSGGGDFYGVRDWHPGDSQRSIHWRMTAKLGELAVRQFEELDSFDLSLVLDLWCPEHDEGAWDDHVETAVSFAATVVHDVCRQSGTRLRVSLLGDEVWQLQGVATPRFRLQVMQELAFRKSSCSLDTSVQLQTLAAAPDRLEQVVVISTRSLKQAGIVPAANNKFHALAGRLHWFCVGDEQLGKYFQMRSRDSELAEFTSTLNSFEQGNRKGRSSRLAGRRVGVGG